jgi:hypothetical protein
MEALPHNPGESELPALQTAFQNLPEPFRWTFAALLFLIALFLLGASLRRRSVLVRPERFLLSADDPEHLVGREQEIRELAGECARHPLVWLLGESGSGKSALVKAGLIPWFKSEIPPRHGASRLVPLLLDASALRWDSGIRDALTDALIAAFRASDNTAPAILASLEEGKPFDWLSGVLRPGAPEILIIFDQIDDYFLAHHARLMQGSRVVSPEQLMAANPDWAALASLLATHRLHLLLVCRADAAVLLHALRFTDIPGPYLLPRVDERLLAPVLDTITLPREGKEIVVSDPEKGWVQLKARLLRDLRSEGQILPVQLAMALNGLRRLPFLAPRVYERHGGQRGLERLHIERIVRDATRGTGVEERALLSGLLMLVSDDGAKTQRARLDELYRALSEDGESVAAPDTAVEHLLRWHILRQQADREETYLLLYHDYLARGVYETYRYANRFTELLRQRKLGFTEAVGWFQKFWALLSPASQLRLAWARLRGRFRYGEYRRYALGSSVRWLPWCLLLALLVTAGTVWQRTHEARAVENMIAVLREQYAISSLEATTWQQLAALPDRSRLYAVQAMFAAPGHLPRLETHSARLAHAVVGLDSNGSLSRYIFRKILAPILRDAPSASPLMPVASKFVTYLHWTKETADVAATILIQRMQGESDSGNLSALGEALTALSLALEAKDVQRFAVSLVGRMQRESDTKVMKQLGEVLVRLSGYLDAAVVQTGAAALVQLMQQKSDSGNLTLLGEVLEKLSSRLDADAVQPLAATLIQRMQREADSEKLAALGEVLVRLNGYLDAAVIEPVFAVLVHRMQRESDSWAMIRLGKVLVSLRSRLDADTRQPASAALMQRIPLESDIATLAALGEVLVSLSSRLDADAAKRMADALVHEMQRESDSEKLVRLAGVLWGLNSYLDAPFVQSATDILVQQMKRKPDGYQLAILGILVVGLNSRLDAATFERRIGSTKSVGEIITAIRKMLVDVSSHLDAVTARHATDALVQQMQREYASQNLALL